MQANELRWMIQDLAKRKTSDLRWWVSRNGAKGTISDAMRLERWKYDRVARNKPLQYILGTQPFLGHELLVRSPILIPRPETEEMTSKIADRIKSSTLPITSPFRILDLCSGGGCISIGLALLLSKYNIQITGIDINPRATKLAMVNQRLLSIPTTTLNFVTNDIANANLNEFDLIISNPPYINSVDYKGLDASVLDWEDKIALIDESSASGSGFYKRIIEASRGIRKSEYGLPSLVFEYGGNEEQKSVLGDLLKLNGFESEFHKDMFESERVVYGYQ